jgi:hypothetical protein
LAADPVFKTLNTEDLLAGRSVPGLESALPRFRPHRRLGHIALASNNGVDAAGIVSKRKNSAYRSGRSPDWLKMKNPKASAVKREAEEEGGKKKWR